MKLKMYFKKIWRRELREDEEHAMLIDRFFSLILRKLAGIGVRMFKNTKITPNHITVTRAIVFLPLIFYFYSTGTYLGNILGILCSFLNTVFDCVDGGLARTTSQISQVGNWLDHHLDKIMVYFTLMGITLGSYRITQDSVFLIAGIFVLFLHAMIVNTSFDFESKFKGEIFFDVSLKQAVYHNQKSTFLDKILVEFFVFNSFWSYFLFTVRYQVFIGAVFNIMPYMLFYWILAFGVRWIMLSLIYFHTLTKKETRGVLANELLKRVKR